MLTIDAITTSYEALKAAVLDAFEANETAIVTKNALEAMRLSMMMTGEIDGKNEAQREAQARQLLDGKYQAVEMSESAARLAKTRLEIARLDVEKNRAQLRVMELAAVAAE